jgi:prephenate dehydrogenase
VARVSHLPHLMSVLMAGHLTTVPDRHLRLAGQGLRDVTRVAGGDPTLWEQIVGANSAAVLSELRTVADRLSEVIKAVEATPETGELRAQLDRGVDGTRKIPGKHGSAPVAYRQVVVAIPDTPGALARLFTDVGEAGVNVEDISIEHDQVRQVGYLALSVTPEQAPGLVAAMTGHGWNVQA